MPQFQPGSAVALENNKTAYIKAKLGEGGQGTVYLAELDGIDCALKWYHRKIKNGDNRI